MVEVGWSRSKPPEEVVILDHLNIDLEYAMEYMGYFDTW